MKRNKSRVKLLALTLAVLVMAIGFAACGGDTTSDKGASNDIVSAMEAAQAKLEEVSSMTYDMDMAMAMTAEGQSMQINIGGTAECIVDPMAMKMNMNMDMGELGSMDMLMYVAEENGVYTTYTGMDIDGSGNMTWTKQEAADMAALEQYNGKDNMEMYLSSMDSFSEAGVEDVNGSQATRYDGIISQESMKEVMSASGALDQFGTMGYDEAEMETLLNNLGELPISIWIDNTSGLPVKYYMDMTQIIQAVMDKYMTSSGADGTTEDLGSVDSFTMSMTVSGYDNVSEIVIPEEALAAEEATY